MPETKELLRCPCTKKTHLDFSREAEGSIYCTGIDCEHRSGTGFPRIAGQPILVDFASSVLDRNRLLASEGHSDLNRPAGGLRRKVAELLFGTDEPSRQACTEMCRRLKTTSERPCVLVVGGGAIGLGTEALYADPGIHVIAFDIYASAHTQFIADGHNIPLADASVDGVWIQAVLEHVLEPQKVVSEIHRVLRSGGLVYAVTPFMQQVHEGAYDFTRFTDSGHRWLFRRFARIDSGTQGGPGQALIWSVRYLISGLFRSRKAGLVAAVALFWLRFLDRLIPERYRVDGACGVWFMGVKSEQEVSAREAIAYYRGAQ